MAYSFGFHEYKTENYTSRFNQIKESKLEEGYGSLAPVYRQYDCKEDSDWFLTSDDCERWHLAIQKIETRRHIINSAKIGCLEYSHRAAVELIDELLESRERLYEELKHTHTNEYAPVVELIKNMTDDTFACPGGWCGAPLGEHMPCPRMKSAILQEAGKPDTLYYGHPIEMFIEKVAGQVYEDKERYNYECQEALEETSRKRRRDEDSSQ